MVRDHKKRYKGTFTPRMLMLIISTTIYSMINILLSTPMNYNTFTRFFFFFSESDYVSIFAA